MVIKFIIILAVSMYQKMQNVGVECVLQSLLLILYVFMKLNTTYKLVVRHTKFLCEIVDKQLIHSLDDNLFEMDKVDKAIHLLQHSVLHNLEYISSACQRNQYQK